MVTSDLLDRNMYKEKLNNTEAMNLWYHLTPGYTLVRTHDTRWFNLKRVYVNHKINLKNIQKRFIIEIKKWTKLCK